MWEGDEIFLTFDMDWVNDEVLEYFHDMICELDVCGTLFVTHETPVLDIIRSEGRLGLGIHPNFNKLIDHSEPYHTNAQTKIRELIKIVPEASAVRSHALVRSSILSKYFAINGMKYEVNLFYPVDNGVKIKCFKDTWGMIQIPFILEEDIYLMSDVKYTMKWYLGKTFLAPLIFNFHPLHLFLNTDKIEQYDEAKPYTRNYTMLKRYRDIRRDGIEKKFRTLVNLAKERKYMFRKLKEVDWQKECESESLKDNRERGMLC